MPPAEAKGRYNYSFDTLHLLLHTIEWFLHACLNREHGDHWANPLITTHSLQPTTPCMPAPKPAAMSISRLETVPPTPSRSKKKPLQK
ncbi:GDSL-like Lipase/Acylhydrolase [Musa troglodytarum]|uniref:GDSL-like Lipase/Acylhydrolase n=1 Tax=Musa troglodytarum TaxID=320322 RepID=A0A9E7JPA9_9LILI|nr:GDSL-like Lipase/Acylhydrolase [Musa troglodytarum]